MVVTVPALKERAALSYSCEPEIFKNFDFLRNMPRYVGYCKRHGVEPNSAIISSFCKAEVEKTCNEKSNLEIILDQVIDVDIRPLIDIMRDIDLSDIDAVDVRDNASCTLDGEHALSLMRAVNKKLRVVDLQDLSFGRDFCRDLSHNGLPCESLYMRSSHLKKLNMMGEFLNLQTLNLDFSTSLCSYNENCFSHMPNLRLLSMCETRITNLWTTVAALRKLPSLTEVRFQKWLYCDSSEPFPMSSISKKDDRFQLGLQNDDHYTDGSSIDIGQLTDQNPSAADLLRNLFSLNNVFDDQDLTSEESSLSDDSELDFASQRRIRRFGQQQLHSSFPVEDVHIGARYELDSGTLWNQNEEEVEDGSSANSPSDVASKYISCSASPICFEKHYRSFMIASLVNLKVLDDLPISNIDRESAAATFSRHFESLPYRRRAKESIVNILQKREIKENHSCFNTKRKGGSCLSGTPQQAYTRSLCAAKVGSSAWPLLQPLSISTSSIENHILRPRQFEYHPSISSLMVFGTLDGQVIVVNHESGKVVGHIPSFGAMSSVLGLCWLKKYPSKLIAGSDNGSLRLYDIQQISPTAAAGMNKTTSSTTFDDFDQLTSVHVNSEDDLFLVSGYSKNVALYDINSGRRLQVFADMHREHINVVKFANHSPFTFATSSFDRDVKLWDLRQKPVRPCYTATSSKGNVMVCFSPDDHYLLASAVDNEVKQLLAVDGRIHLDFEIAPTGSSQNYTRSYYLNGRDYIISGSCDEHVVRVCCAQTGRRLRDVSLEGRGSGTSMFVQSLRGDPFREFSMSILAAYMRPSSKSEIVKVNLMVSSDNGKEQSCSHGVPPSHSLGG